MRKLLLAVLGLVACGDSNSSGFVTGMGGTNAAGSTGQSSGASGSTGAGTSLSTEVADDSAGSGAGSSSTGVVQDLGTVPDFGPVKPEGCKGKVDLIFVIARSPSMTAVQAQLVASFPGFVQTIQEQLADFDVHIMAVNPEAYWPGWSCEETGCKQSDPPSCGAAAEGYQCNVYPWLITECDETLGAGLIFNAGAGAANRQCELFGGNRYIINDEPNLDDALECIAKVGWSGGKCPMGEALVAALDPAMNDMSGCNSGFLRDDALLVVTMISDRNDLESYTWPYQWYDKIIAAKKDPNAVVMLGIVPQPHVDGEPYEMGCTYDDAADGKIRGLIDMFPHHAYGDTCAKSYAPFFVDAAAKIAEACDSFVPQ